MTEFDFDELDRSISAAMAKNNTKKMNSSASRSALGANRPTISEHSDTSGENHPMDASEPTVKSIVGSHRRGQFMDMVHPSSNMTARRSQIVPRKSHTVQPITLPNERSAAQGSTLSSGANVETETNSPEIENRRAKRPAVDAFQFDKESTGVVSNDLFTTQKSDNITEHGSRSDVNGQPVNDSMLSLVVPPDNISPASAVDVTMHDSRQASAASELHEPAYTEPEAQASPFLPNAKLVKRPLDAWQQEQEPSMQQMNDLSAVLQADLEVSQPGETLTANAIPAALRDSVPADNEDDKLDTRPMVNAEPKTGCSASEVVKPETTSTSFFDPTRSEGGVTESSQQAVLESPKRDTPRVEAIKADPEPTLDMSATIEEVAALESEQHASVNGATSIPQQYVERDVALKPNTAIYDTEQYHIGVDDDAPALEQVPILKAKKSPVARTVWLVVLLLLGSLAGAVGYYFLMNR
ncbi:MAG: hypothetical protein D8G53_07075 [Candidatus Saccharimonas sp.]|nr:MAG: hypothetical protein D8G53_07075 [Candidatus Saccharimonas sp.]